jgi:hypothetical protein
MGFQNGKCPAASAQAPQGHPAINPGGIANGFRDVHESLVSE